MKAVIVAALAMPPPVTGQTVVNAHVVGLLESSGAKIRLIDISPKQYRRSIAYHAQRIFSVMAVPFVLAANRRSRPRTFYTVVDAGHGMIYTIVTSAAARLFGYRLFLHHHGASFLKTHTKRFEILSRVAGTAATHVVLSNAMAEDARGRYSFCRRFFVAHNASHVDDPGETEHLKKNKLAIGFLSNLSLEKGIDTVLDAFARVRASGVDACLFLAGPVADEAVEELVSASQRRFGDDVVRLGPVSGQVKEQFFKRLDVFLFPSRYKVEAQPMVVLEALSYGIPAIVTPQGYTAEICEPLGTVAEPSRYIDDVVAFVRRWISDQEFSITQRTLARRRFVNLKEDSRLELTQLVALMRS
jgi:glycosyltransferase involved in cell wall biosynthesis